MSTFTTVSWSDGWNRSIKRFKELNKTNDIIARNFFGRKDELFVEIIFSNGETVILSQDMLEGNL